MQTLENNPAIIHGGPFANIAHGCNSILATKMALKLGDYVVTEAGFGADLGAEKFLDIKCRNLGKSPDAVVIVATLRALKYHGGVAKEDVNVKNTEAIKEGIHNLLKHVENIRKYGLNPIVAINKFNTDTKEELDVLKELLEGKVEFSLLENWAKGGEGSIDLAKKIVNICEKEKDFKPIYELSGSIREKIETIAKEIYGATGITYSEQAIYDLEKIEKLAKNMPVCIAKTQYSFSDDPKNLLCEEPFNINVTSIEIKNGAEFIVVKAGKIMTMPGLPKNPAAEKIDIDENGNIIGIF